MDKRQEGIDAMWEEFEGRKKERPSESTEEENWLKLKQQCYGTNVMVICEGGLMDFSPSRIKDIVGGENMDYDTYLEVMHRSLGNIRSYFQTCFYYACDYHFKGRISKILKNRICFDRIFVSGCYNDGMGFEGKEDHVWIDKKGFENFVVDDCVSFTAEVYRYRKQNPVSINFGLRNPDDIEKIESYQIPTDDELLMQSIDQIVCEVCMYNEHCYMGMCIANEQWRESMRQMLFEAAKNHKGS